MARTLPVLSTASIPFQVSSMDCAESRSRAPLAVVGMTGWLPLGFRAMGQWTACGGNDERHAFGQRRAGRTEVEVEISRAEGGQGLVEVLLDLAMVLRGGKGLSYSTGRQSRPLTVPQTLLVKKSSSRFLPERRIPSPTSSSFP